MRGFSSPSKWHYAAIGAVAFVLFTADTSKLSANDVEPITVSVRFILPATLSPDDPNLDFGKLTENMQAGDTITIGPDGSLTDSVSRRLSTEPPKPAMLALDTNTEVSVNIKISNVASGTGYSLSNFMCNYDDGTATACDGIGMDTTTIDAAALIKVGATLTGDGNSSPAGPSNGSFDLTVSYN